jgi:hypothetical protein
MFVDLDLETGLTADQLEFIKNWTQMGESRRLFRGIYTGTQMHNFLWALDVKRDDRFYSPIGYVYGVCDSVAQFMNDYYYTIDAVEGNWIVSLEEVYRADQPKYDGWRWAKWGPYLGEEQRTSDYLVNEQFIDKVCVFNLYHLTGTKGLLLQLRPDDIQAGKEQNEQIAA